MTTWIRKLLYASEHGGVHLSPAECALLAKFLQNLSDVLSNNTQSVRGNDR